MSHQGSPKRGDLQAALDLVRPRIHAHHGDVEIARVDDEGHVELKLTGNCVGCPYQAVTFGVALHDQLNAVEGVTDVSLEGRELSPKLLARLKRVHAPRPATHNTQTTHQENP
jgi:Fe-S cluster biogenesis protein NfuA